MYTGLKYEINDKNLPEAAEEFAALKEIAEKEREIRSKIRQKFEASHLFIFLGGFSSMGLSRGERETSLRFEHGRAYLTITETNLRKDFVTIQRQPPIPPFAYVGEKTLNMLLGGKLLTDAEKRTIVEKLKILGDDSPTGEQPQTATA